MVGKPEDVNADIPDFLLPDQWLLRNPRGTAAGIVEAVNEAKPCHVRLVGVVVQGRTTSWWWRWVEPVALWLLERAGFEVCR